MELVGFTGTQKGMTGEQMDGVITLLKQYKSELAQFRHGLCVGADVQAATLAYVFGYHIVAYPGHPEWNVKDLSRRGVCFNHEVMKEENFLKRNQSIINASRVLIAAPKDMYEVLRSGTWAAVRYARTRNVKIWIVRPDGSLR